MVMVMTQVVCYFVLGTMLEKNSSYTLKKRGIYYLMLNFFLEYLPPSFLIRYVKYGLLSRCMPEGQSDAIIIANYFLTYFYSDW